MCAYRGYGVRECCGGKRTVELQAYILCLFIINKTGNNPVSINGGMNKLRHIPTVDSKPPMKMIAHG
jgi:hypothetical protein